MMTSLMTYLAKIRLFNRDVHLFLVTIFIFGFTFDGGIYSVIFNLYLLRLGYGPEAIGQINSVGLLAFALVSLPVGMVGSRWGSRRMMIVGLLSMLIGAALLPAVEFVPPQWQTGWLCATYVLILLGVSAYFVNSAPLLMSLTTAETRNYAFSVQVALWSFAAFAGSLIGGLLPGLFAGIFSLSLAEPIAYRLPLMLVTILLIPALVAMLAIKEPNELPPANDDKLVTPANVNLATAFPWMLIIVLVGVRLFQVAGFASIIIFFNVYLDTQLSVSTALIGVLAGVGRLVAVLASLTMPILTARYGNNQLVIWATLGGAIAMLPLVFMPHWGAAGVSFAGVAALAAIRFPAFLVYSMEVVSPARRGLVAGSGEMAAGLCFSMIALTGGYIIATFGYETLFLVTAGLTAFSALLFGVYFRVPRGELAQPEMELQQAAAQP